MTTLMPSDNFIEVDDGLGGSSDYDSSDAASSTQSLASSLNRYLEENGRRYHAYYGADKHYMPTDEPEKERLDIHHEIIRLITGGLYKAPLENPHKVLDLGTGTGIWCVDFADENPQAEVTGVDLSPIQPDWVPTNCKFEVDDLELDWTFPADAYDFIHSRNLLASIKDVDKLLKQIFSRLKPGGFVQCGEFDGQIISDDNTIPENWPPTVCVDLTFKAMDMIGRKFWTGHAIERALTDAGFVDVEVVVSKQPYGPWAMKKDLKQAGMLALIQSETGFHSYALALFTRVLGMSEEEARKLCDDARDAMLWKTKKEKVHAYTNFVMVYARKPEASV